MSVEEARLPRTLRLAPQTDLLDENHSVSALRTSPCDGGSCIKPWCNWKTRQATAVGDVARSPLGRLFIRVALSAAPPICHVATSAVGDVARSHLGRLFIRVALSAAPPICHVAPSAVGDVARSPLGRLFIRVALSAAPPICHVATSAAPKRPFCSSEVSYNGLRRPFGAAEGPPCQIRGRPRGLGVRKGGRERYVAKERREVERWRGGRKGYTSEKAAERATWR